jgi:hypothetical protein
MQIVRNHTEILMQNRARSDGPLGKGKIITNFQHVFIFIKTIIFLYQVPSKELFKDKFLIRCIWMMLVQVVALREFYCCTAVLGFFHLSLSGKPPVC